MGIVERLRKSATEEHILECEDFPYFLGKTCQDFYSCKDCARAVFNAIADEIEAEQAERQLPDGIQWPRFEDGELVKFGDEVETNRGPKKVMSVLSSLKSYTLYEGIGDGKPIMFASYGLKIRRPEPEVLDADGVPVKVGETVYHKETGKPLKVFSLANGEVHGDEKPNVTATYSASFITHRKPDTQEAIIADLELPAWDYLKKYGLLPVKAEGETKKEYKLRVRLAHRKHLLERQCKLLGGE